VQIAVSWRLCTQRTIYCIAFFCKLGLLVILCLCPQIFTVLQNMPRGKNKKKQFSKRPSRQTEKTHEVNPFELKINRQKHEVLGRKVSKTDKGMPGVSRSRAIKKVRLWFVSCCRKIDCLTVCCQQLRVFMHAEFSYCYFCSSMLVGCLIRWIVAI